MPTIPTPPAACLPRLTCCAPPQGGYNVFCPRDPDTITPCPCGHVVVPCNLTLGTCKRADGELYARWLQFGALSPIMRTHCSHCDRRIWIYPPAQPMAWMQRRGGGCGLGNRICEAKPGHIWSGSSNKTKPKSLIPHSAQVRGDEGGHASAQCPCALPVRASPPHNHSTYIRPSLILGSALHGSLQEAGGRRQAMT